MRTNNDPYPTPYPLSIYLWVACPNQILLYILLYDIFFFFSSVLVALLRNFHIRNPQYLPLQISIRSHSSPLYLFNCSLDHLNGVQRSTPPQIDSDTSDSRRRWFAVSDFRQPHRRWILSWYYFIGPVVIFPLINELLFYCSKTFPFLGKLLVRFWDLALVFGINLYCFFILV